MDDDQYLEELMTQVSARKIRSLDDVADDVRTNLNKAVESIIDAGKALQEGRDMHPSDQAFGNWCANEFPELGSRTRSNMMAIARRFGQHLNAHQLGYSVLAELAAPSVSDDVVEQVINAPIPMKLAEVKELKKSVYKTTSDTFEHWTGHKNLLNLLLSQERAIIEVEEARALNDLSAYEEASELAMYFEEDLGASRTQLKAYWDTYNSWRVSKLLICYWLKVTRADEEAQVVAAIQTVSTSDQLAELSGGDWRAMWFAVEMKLGQIIHSQGWATEERQGWGCLEAIEGDIQELCDAHGEEAVHKALSDIH